MALFHIGFFSESLGMCAACDVIVPQYAAARAENANAPKKVLWLLHGASDNHTYWQRQSSIERYAKRYGLSVVMPNAHLSSYADMTHGGRYFTYIAEELPRVMRSFFGFSSAREDNYIAGLSMGGTGCLKIGLARPQNYAAIGCMSAGAPNFRLQMMRDNPAWKARIDNTYGGRDLTGTEEDALFNAREIVKNGLPAPRIYHTCGSDDFLLQTVHDTRDFFQSLPGNPFDYVYEEHPGSHTWEYWDEHIQRFLEYLRLPRADGVVN